MRLLFRITPFFEGAIGDAQKAGAPDGLPKTNEEIAAAISRIETRFNEVRLKVSAPKTTQSFAVIGLAATPDELTEREQLLQQWPPM